MNDVDTSGTISMEEEIQEGYEPSQQEIIDYAIHLGMDLVVDSRYLDIARAGLKAPLPYEWKPCQKNRSGGQDFFYKNIQTGDVSHDHPCDLIFRKRYQDAKQLDNKQTKKKSGMNKFKQAVEQQRDEDVLDEQEQMIHEQRPPPSSKVNLNKQQTTGGMRPLEFGNDIEEDKSFMIESNINMRNRNPTEESHPLTKNNSMQQSTLQKEQINQDFIVLARDYEREKQTTLGQYKQRLIVKQQDMEEVYINEQNPDLAILKRQFEEKVKQNKDRLTQDKTRQEKQIQGHMEEAHNDAEQKLKHRSDTEIKQSEDAHERKLKSQLKSFAEDLRYQHLDQRKKIDAKRKQMEESDKKLLRELEEKRRRVKEQSEVEGSKMSTETKKKLSQLDQDVITTLKQEKDRFLKSIKEESLPESNYIKQQIQELKSEHEQLTRDIGDQFKSMKNTSVVVLQKTYKSRLEEYEQLQRPHMDEQLRDHNKKNEDQIKSMQIQNTQLRDQHIQQLHIDLKDYEQQKRKELEKQKELLQDKKKSRFQALKDKYGKSQMDGKLIDKEIELFMQQDQIKIDIEVIEDTIKRLQKERIIKKERIQELQQVTVRFDLTKESHNSELIKFELEHKHFLVQKQQDKHDTKQKEMDQLQRDIETIEMKQTQNVEKVQKMDQMMQSVNQLKDLFFNQQSQQQFNQQHNESKIQPQQYGESKLQQSLFVKDMSRSLIKNKSSVAPPTTDHSKQFRQWQTKIVEERVKLNRQKEECKSQKVVLQSSQTYLLKEQNQLRSEIQETNISYHQPNPIKKDLLRKMKLDIQIKLKQLSSQITHLNEKKNLLQQKDAALSQIEKIIDRQIDDSDYPQKYHQIIENIRGLYELYVNIGQVMPDSSLGEEQESFQDETQSKPPLNFHQDMDDILGQQDVLDAPPNLKDRNNKLVTFDAHDRQDFQKSSSELRHQLVDHQDWLQKCKYQLSKNLSRSPESRRQLNNYSSMLINQQ